MHIFFVTISILRIFIVGFAFHTEEHDIIENQNKN